MTGALEEQLRKESRIHPHQRISPEQLAEIAWHRVMRDPMRDRLKYLYGVADEDLPGDCPVRLTYENRDNGSFANLPCAFIEGHPGRCQPEKEPEGRWWAIT